MSEISAYRDGVEFERERIIKLLESKIHWIQHDGSIPNTLEDPAKIIALIKGEEQ